MAPSRRTPLTSYRAAKLEPLSIFVKTNRSAAIAAKHMFAYAISRKMKKAVRLIPHRATSVLKKRHREERATTQSSQGP
jgi:hypothetical protein